MLEYEATGTCRMLFLRGQLDDATATAACGRCDNCTGRRWDTVIDEATAQRVAERLTAPGVRLSQRRQWPTGISVRGRIHGVAAGRALGRLNDIARGPALNTLLTDRSWRPTTPWQQDTWLPRIVAVLADWDWDTRPTTVVALGSHDPAATEFTAALAEAVAAVGRMAWAGVLPVRPGVGEVTAQNSAYRVAALLDHWDFSGIGPTDGPVLLVTDVIDTGWSVTVAGVGLAERTGQTVLPFALASRG